MDLPVQTALMAQLGHKDLREYKEKKEIKVTRVMLDLQDPLVQTVPMVRDWY